MSHFLWLTNHTIYTSLQVKQNTKTFLWSLEMPSIFIRHQELFVNKKIEYQERLKRQVELFRKDLRKYSEMVKDYENWGNLASLAKYRDQAALLDKNLVDAIDKIDRINEEEAAYGWESTQYPIRKETHDILIPYKKLFDAGQDFIEKSSEWLNAQIGSYDPEEVIESEVGSLYRTTLKMEKFFSGKPETHKLAEDVSL